MCECVYNTYICMKYLSLIFDLLAALAYCVWKNILNYVYALLVVCVFAKSVSNTKFHDKQFTNTCRDLWPNCQLNGNFSGGAGTWKLSFLNM